MNYLNIIFKSKVKECFEQSAPTDKYTVYICLRTVGEYKNRVLIRKNDNSVHTYSNERNGKIVFHDYHNIPEWSKDPCAYPPFDGDWTMVGQNMNYKKARELAETIADEIGLIKDVRVDVDFGNGIC